MNTEQANSIPLSEILEKMDRKPVKQYRNQVLYFSPLRIEKTPSFFVKTSRNVWYDFGIEKGGTVIDLVITYLKNSHEDHTCADALRWIGNMTLDKSPSLPLFVPEKTEEKLKYSEAEKLNQIVLFRYLKSRGISARVANKYLKQIQVTNPKTQKKFYVLALPNENGGFELSNKFFKGSCGGKDITFIRGTKQKQEMLNLFEAKMDFFSVLEYENKTVLEDDTILLNSVSNLRKALPYIKNYGYQAVHAWLDNDNAGEKTVQALKDLGQSEGKFAVKKMNDLYKGHKDVNAWHMSKLGK